MKKKVLFFTAPTCGGAERVTITIAKLLDPDLYDVSFAIVGKTTGDITQFIPKGCNVYYVKIFNIWDFTTIKIFQLLKKIKPAIVFSSLFYLNTRVATAAHFVGGIKIILRNSNNYFAEKNIATRLLMRISYPFADEIIMQTEEMADEFNNTFPVKCKKISVIHNPIDVDTITRKLENISNPFDTNNINYVYVGRITVVKGLDALIKAFAKVYKCNHKSRLYIVGKYDKNDAYYKSLIKLIDNLNIGDSVVFVGFTSNPYQYVKYANCMILPSRNEGLPNVVLEAMFLKCPVVVTRSIPIIDRLVTKDRGIVINVDDIEGLSKAMNNILSLTIQKNYQADSDKKFLMLFQ